MPLSIFKPCFCLPAVHVCCQCSSLGLDSWPQDPLAWSSTSIGWSQPRAASPSLDSCVIFLLLQWCSFFIHQAGSLLQHFPTGSFCNGWPPQVAACFTVKSKEEGGLPCWWLDAALPTQLLVSVWLLVVPFPRETCDWLATHLQQLIQSSFNQLDPISQTTHMMQELALRLTVGCASFVGAIR